MPLKGARAHVRRLRALASPAMADVVDQVLFHSGELIQVEAQLSITRGAVSGKNHVAAPHNAPPNADTHVLDSNIETTRHGRNRVRVTSNAPYSARHEFGPEGRAFMRPARDKMKPVIQKNLTKAVKKQVRASRRSD